MTVPFELQIALRYLLVGGDVVPDDRIHMEIQRGAQRKLEPV